MFGAMDLYARGCGFVRKGLWTCLLGAGRTGKCREMKENREKEAVMSREMFNFVGTRHDFSLPMAQNPSS